MEALVGIALLATGVGAASTAFSATRDAVRSGQRRQALADCARKKFLETTLAVPVDALCSDEFQWSEQRTRLSPRLEKTIWTAVWSDNGTPHEESFEMVH